MQVKFVIGIAVPLVLASAPATAFGLVGLVATVASAAVGAAGGAALSSSGVGPAGQVGAIPSASALGATSAGRTAWASTKSGFVSLAPSPRGEVPQSAVRIGNFGWVNGTPDALAELGKPLPRRLGVSPRAMRLCRNAVARELAPHGAVQVETASAGRASRVAAATAFPLIARVIYRHPAGYEVKQATIKCQVTKAGVQIATR